MRHYYSADAIRAAEAPLLASLPDGALMRRAAYGLATAIAGELVIRTGGVAGRRVCAVVGSGDNGGDALWAATFLRRRGVAADAILLNPSAPMPQALAAFRRSGGRIVQSVSTTTDLVIDGVVGISASGPLRPAAAAIFDSTDVPVVAVDIPSGIDVHTGAVDGPAVRAALTVTFGGLKPVHALGDCGRVELIDIGLDLPPSDVLGFEAADVEGPLADTRAHRRQVQPGCHRRAGRIGNLSRCRNPVQRGGGSHPFRHGPLRGKCCSRGGFALARSHRRRRVSPLPAGCRPGWSVRVSAPTSKATAPWRRSRHRSAGRRRRRCADHPGRPARAGARLARRRRC